MTDKLTAMTAGGKKLARVRDQLAAQIKPGTSLQALDQLADQLILKTGGQASFKLVPNYHWATCININQGVVHGIPNDYIIQAGDLVSLDVGLFYQGYHTDTSTSVIAGNVKPPQKVKLLKVGQQALDQAIAAPTPDHHVGHISRALEQVLLESGYSPVRRLTGHGIGKALHEFPPVPCFIEGRPEATPKLIPGMTLAVEAIYTAGSPELVTDPDDKWTITTQDGSMAGLFEHTIAVTDKHPLILTV